MLYREAFQRLMKDKFVVACLIVIGVSLVLALLSWFPAVAANPQEQYKEADEITLIERSYHPPSLLIAIGVIDEANNKPLTPEQEKAFEWGLFSKAAWSLPLGGDKDGRSVLSMSLHGLRYAFIIGLVTTIISVLIAVPIGAAAGFFGGVTDELIVWFYTTLVAIPQLLLLIALTIAMPDSIKSDPAWGLIAVLVAIGITTWVGLARLIRAEFMKHKQREYVQAARALGFTNSRIMFKHMFPNVTHIVIIYFTISFVGAVNLEVFLSFVGIGIPATTPTWGQMISEAKNELTREPNVWWPLTTATLFLFTLSLAFSIAGDALRDALDPKLRTG